MSYDVNGKQTQVGDKVIFTDPWHGKHEATITELEPKNGSHHATLEIDEATSDLPDVDHSLQWFKSKAGKFEDVPHHAEGVPYSCNHKE